MAASSQGSALHPRDMEVLPPFASPWQASVSQHYEITPEVPLMTSCEHENKLNTLASALSKKIRSHVEVDLQVQKSRTDVQGCRHVVRRLFLCRNVCIGNGTSLLMTV